ncbi:hypothetical protein [Pinibacter soli]|uniref:Tyr recombinase domain-containing protein n=1 Tax=Pinibacter soli TaxID=3044211 RepID=A0ABT6RE84_9BACT|nr:hypothetical protein [Pinibacter soli]MDI3320833.1 hypothetical protein [Pinibacter soli]
MSYSDVKEFNTSTIYTDSSGAKWIDSKRVKTGVDYDVPLFPQVIKILEKYYYKLPVVSNQKMNAYLEEIADVCGITKNMTTHMARRTFASITNEQGVNILLYSGCWDTLKLQQLSITSLQTENSQRRNA